MRKNQESPRGSCQLGRKGTQGLLGVRREKTKVWNTAGDRVFMVCSDPDQSRHAGREEVRRD